MNEGSTKLNEDYEAYLRIWVALTDADLPLPAECVREIRMAFAAVQAPDREIARHIRRALAAAKETPAPKRDPFGDPQIGDRFETRGQLWEVRDVYHKLSGTSVGVIDPADRNHGSAFYMHALLTFADRAWRAGEERPCWDRIIGSR